jgi:HK97 gp10 family phage protein
VETVSLKIQVLGVNQAINNIEKYMQRKHLGLLGAVIESSKDISSTAKSLTPVDLGELRTDINYTVADRKNSIEGNILSSAPYSTYVEFGSRPHRPPAKALEGWADRHGIPVGAVIASIAKKGTKAQPFMTPAAMAQKPKFIRAVRRVMSSP